MSDSSLEIEWCLIWKLRLSDVWSECRLISVSSSQLVASIVSSYTTTTVRELNDDFYSLYLDDLATDLYNSFHRSLHHSSFVVIVHLDSSHARDVIIMWALSSFVTIMMLVDRFMRRDRVRDSGDDDDDYFWWRWRLVDWWRCGFSQWWRRWLARLMQSLVMVQTILYYISSLFFLLTIIQRAACESFSRKLFIEHEFYSSEGFPSCIITFSRMSRPSDDVTSV
jgi:hypothetical protein